MHRRRHVEDGALGGEARGMSLAEVARARGLGEVLLVALRRRRLALLAALRLRCRGVDEVVRVCGQLLAGLEVVPVWRHSPVVEDEPRAQRILPLHVVLQYVHQPVQVVREELPAIRRLPQAEQCEVLARRALPHAGHRLRTQNLVCLEANIRGLALRELGAERSVRQADAVTLPLATTMGGLEALVAEILHVIHTSDIGGLDLALRADHLLEKDKGHVLPLPRGVHLRRGGAAEDVVGAGGDDVRELRLVLHAIQETGGRNLLHETNPVELDVHNKALYIDAVVDGDVLGSDLLHPEVGVLD
mmetsp:Transcript_28143/g.80899  ORF Transcript_28143/g.80899 Transcript_28143/m.80899 type:complete len:303 (-) Transcript_28143:645-1553(-)